ncbi:MAG: ACP S-malonyltransferase [Pseudomonadota bacterium]
MVAIMFPGQGSQTVGMGKGLAQTWPQARDVFAEVDEALGESLSALMFEGEAEILTLTENTQPALLATSIAAFRVLQAETGLPGVTALAGHSVGEYAALVAAESLTLRDAARLVRLRGREMQRAVPPGEGAMIAVLGLEVTLLTDLAHQANTQGHVCAIANDNCPGQLVISGHRAAVLRVGALAKEHGARRVIELAVSAPFHCALMAPAAHAMAQALSTSTIQAPKIPVYANVTAAPIGAAADIKDLLSTQVTATVRWRETIEALVAAGTIAFIESGEGTVLSGLVKRIKRDAPTFSLAAPQTMRTAIDWLVNLRA